MNKAIIPAVLACLALAPFSHAQFDLPGLDASDLKSRAPSGGAWQDAAPFPVRDVSWNKAVGEPEKLKIGLVSKAERKEYITRAQLWRPEETLNLAAVDFKAGPYESNKYRPEELVTCNYIPMAEAYDSGKPNGMTPKFKCRDQRGKELKVKYGRDNGEVITEVAASWILTAIGAYADKMYPVRLTCPDCPSDPYKDETDKGSWPAGSMVAIEDKLGERIERKANSGIGFDEFHLMEDRVGAEALAGMTQFLGNSDNKAANQAIACHKKDIVVADQAAGKAVCLKPVVYLQDMGISFGGRGFFHNGRMDFDKWAKEKVWDDPARCALRLNTAMTSSLKDVDPSGRDMHQIGEKARQMMWRRLSLLSREQLTDIFTAARAPLRKPKHTAEEWADLFMRKVEMLRSPMGAATKPDFVCPFEVVPPNSAPPPAGKAANPGAAEAAVGSDDLVIID